MDPFRVDLSHLGLTSLSRELEFMSGITCLDLSGNEFSSVPEVVLTMSDLEQLDLTSNSLCDLTPLIKLTNLKELRANRNQLSSFPFELHKLPKLERLFLSFNNITSIEGDLDLFPASLQQLNLSNNQIDSLPPKPLPVFVNVRSNPLRRLPQGEMGGTQVQFKVAKDSRTSISDVHVNNSNPFEKDATQTKSFSTDAYPTLKPVDIDDQAGRKRKTSLRAILTKSFGTTSPKRSATVSERPVPSNSPPMFPSANPPAPLSPVFLSPNVAVDIRVPLELLPPPKVTRAKSPRQEPEPLGSADAASSQIPIHVLVKTSEDNSLAVPLIIQKQAGKEQAVEAIQELLLLSAPFQRISLDGSPSWDWDSDFNELTDNDLLIVYL